MAHTLEDLRDHLFETLKSLRDTDNPMSIDRAKAISDVAQTVINSAKVEVDYIRATGEDASLPVFGGKPKQDVAPALPPGVRGITEHKLRG